MKTPLLPNESLLRDGAASLKRGWETVGGWMYLTNWRLIFEPHAINLQTDCFAIPLVHIKDVDPVWTKVLGIPLVPNGLLVNTADGYEFRFIVFQRAKWAEAIEYLRKAP